MTWILNCHSWIALILWLSIKAPIISVMKAASKLLTSCLQLPVLDSKATYQDTTADRMSKALTVKYVPSYIQEGERG